MGYLSGNKNTIAMRCYAGTRTDHARKDESRLKPIYIARLVIANEKSGVLIGTTTSP